MYAMVMCHDLYAMGRYFVGQTLTLTLENVMMVRVFRKSGMFLGQNCGNMVVVLMAFMVFYI